MAQRFEGVYTTAKKDGTPSYRSSVTYHGKHISLGSYDNPETAHAAYNDARAILYGTAYSTLDSLTACPALSFEKCISLMNLRDNRVYFSTPIYLRPRFFYYYLAPDCILKFDSDDLFYFSSHKIMRRGGHFFVADFGMQVNIMNRFSIKNYAVAGRDFRFRNGDIYDFRRENLEIMNKYHGVFPYTPSGSDRILYRAKLHLNGDYIVGTYETMEEAAVAYNKAVDVVKKNGCTKNFPTNYLENISGAVYAQMYVDLDISDKILNYRFP